MKRFRIAISIILTFIIFISIPQMADAAEGTISVTMAEGNQIVADGSLTLYHVADLKKNETEYEFPYVTEWAECQAVLDDLQSAELAEELKEFALELNINGVTKEVDAEGNVRFEHMTEGVYLIVQKDAAEGYHAVNPFLITVPQMVDGELTYDIDASPKVGLVKENKPDTPEKPDKPSGTTNSKLYQTGQLNWPIPVLAVSGLLLFAIGWYLCFAKKEK